MLEAWFIIGTDLNGRKCYVSQIYLPSGLSEQEALKAVQKRGGWYTTVSEVTKNPDPYNC